MSSIDRSEVRTFIEEYLSRKLKMQGRILPAPLPDDCDLLFSGFIDSLGLLELIEAIRDHCNRDIDFEPLDPEHMTVIGPLCKFVSDQISDG